MAQEEPLELEDLDPIDLDPTERDQLLEKLRQRDAYKKAMAGTFPDWMSVKSV